MNKYTALVIVEGIKEDCVGNLKIGDFELMDPMDYGFEAVGFLNDSNVLAQMRKAMKMPNVFPLCFRKTFVLDGELNDNAKKIQAELEEGLRCLDITMRLASCKDSRAVVAYAACFDEKGIGKSGMAGFDFLSIGNTEHACMFEADSQVQEQLGEFYGQVCKLYFDGQMDSRKHNILIEFYSSMFGFQNHRFVIMMTCFEMLLADKTVRDKGYQIATIVSRLCPDDDRAFQDMREIYDVRNDFIHEGKTDRIGVVFPRLYELLVKVMRIILDDDFDMNELKKLRADSKRRR